MAADSRPPNTHSAWGAGDETSPLKSRPLRFDSDSQRVTLGFAFGKSNRGFEWRDGLAVYWIVGLILMLLGFGWLASIGVPRVILVPVVLGTLIASIALFIWAARGARPPSS